MLKYLSKFAMDILPSLAATIIGAYIVNHYIVTKPSADAPAAAVSSVDPKKADAKPTETSSDVASFPEPGVRAKGLAEKTVLEKATPEKAALEKSAVESAAPKSPDKPTETASIPSEPRRRLAGPHEKTAAKPIAMPVLPAATAAAPGIAAPNSAPSVEAAIGPEEHRDANDMARAAIERLRNLGDGSSRAPETTRVPDVSRSVVTASPVIAPLPVRPLPPPIVVATPGAESFGSMQPRPSYPATAAVDDPSRPTPPAEIPLPPPLPPLVLHAEASGPLMREHTNVAEDMLAAAKSVFHAVLPR